MLSTIVQKDLISVMHTCKIIYKLQVTYTYDSNGVFKGEFLDVESGKLTEFEGNL
jgi:hypothetical protein